ncbi:hypothetical protein NPS01_28660 [Nocardioides psychrotolerans]|uniref:Uncharacterized protein n=1 Tax=Nocardioides psychrotolerans TaxID=1005945 RepID=A0A1I3EQ65_9ACTN|nr:hypothetical protein [Nocardioides psychrotolerans]GEP39203.1 hypothetical protein NPS01_28660 [Nocardioides psychrotolerans]SFI01114.1 hypothetical protein SAMN05216561_1047 [Nocardioides psychrotolerans]
MRRIILGTLIALIAAVAFGSAVAAGGHGSSVTQARLERSLPVAFANLYVEKARLLGRDDLTPESLHAEAMCDKHGPDVADVGPGGDWVCLIGWTDPKMPLPPEGYGKFELNVHSNDCYTVTGPSKIIGFLTMTDTRGREVPNPVFEFDGCFDPNGDNTATDVSFPSLLTVTSTSVTPDDQGRVGLQVSCGAGSDGCSGTLTATAGGRNLGAFPYSLREQSTGTLTLPTSVPDGADEVAFQLRPATGVGPTSPASLPVQRP